MKGWAQSGEDRWLIKLFRKIGTTNRIAVEFGALDGLHGSNTAYFRLIADWRVFLFDAAPLSPVVQPAFITAENVNDVFHEAGIPTAFDLLSIDINGQDLWVWKALTARPRVVVIEFNARWGPRDSRTVPYHPDFRWDKTNYFGASVLAMTRLGTEKGYTLLGATRANLIFVEDGLTPYAIGPADVPLVGKQKLSDPQRRPWVTYP